MPLTLTRESILASIARDSLPDFIHQAWPLLEPDKPLVWSWHLDVLCDLLTKVTHGEIKRLIINVPPATSKTSIVSILWPCWEWTRDASLRYLTAAYTQDNTIRDNRSVRNIVTSPWYRSNFNVELSSEQSAKIRFDTTQKGWRIATSVGGIGTGEHPNRIIIDDPLKATSSLSVTKAEIEAANNWIDSTISTRIRLEPAIILVMQRLHLDDPSGHLLSKGDGWYHLNLPMHFEVKGKWDCNCHQRPDPLDRRTVEGELLCPESITPETLQQTELLLGQFGVSSQMQQRPVPIGGGFIQREWLAGEGKIVDSAPPGCQWCRGWDTADTPDGGDWTVGVKLGRASNGLWYIAHAERAQKGPGAVDSLIRSVAQVDGITCKIREGSGSGKATIARRTIDLTGYDYAPASETENKLTRFNPFRSQCEAGNVRLVRGTWNEPYLDVITSFPVGKYDDDADATSNAFNALATETRKKRGGTWR